MRRTLRIIGIACSAALMAAVGLAGWLATQGWAVAVVETGSMAPAYPAGSLLVVARVDPDEVHRGDVLSYEDDDGRTISHRVARVSTAPTAQRYFTFRGDANRSEDPLPVMDHQLRGRVVAGAPRLGTVARSALSPVAAGALVVGGLGLVVFELIRNRRSIVDLPAIEQFQPQEAPS